MSKKQTHSAQKLNRRHRRFGWTWLLIWLLFGLVLEMLNGFKASSYLIEPVRREFWQLAHFHGVTLALVNLIYVRWAEKEPLSLGQQNLASWSLIIGSVLMPLGFFLGGLFHFEGDPGLGIFLSPPGALFISITVFLQTLAAWRAED